MKSDQSQRPPQSWEHLFDKDPNTSTGFRIGVVAAILVHAGIFAVTWPTIAQAPPDEPVNVCYPVPIYDFVPTPPEPEIHHIELPVVRPDGPPIIDGDPEEVAFEPTIIDTLAPPPTTVGECEFPVVFPDPPDPPPTIIRAGVDIDPPELVHRVEPRYTEAARQTRIQGVVILELVIDTEGLVESIEVLRGLALGLTKSAVDAVEQWRFQPSTYNERPVAVRYILTIRFTLT